MHLQARKYSRKQCKYIRLYRRDQQFKYTYKKRHSQYGPGRAVSRSYTPFAHNKYKRKQAYQYYMARRHIRKKTDGQRAVNNVVLVKRND